MAIIEALLFLWLSPGMLLTIPPADGGWFASETTSLHAVLTHAALFAGTLVFLTGGRRRRREGFQDAASPSAPMTKLPMASSGARRRLEERKAMLETL
jgi:hypothetical protein